MNVQKHHKISHKKIIIIISDFSKKSISPVVAIALLLVVSIVAVVGFQTWFQSYENNIFSNTEQQSQFCNLEIQTIVGGKLYLKGKAEIQSVKVNGNDCFVSGVTSENLNTIPISDCAEEGENDIVVVTNQGVFEKTILLNNYKYKNPCPEGYILVPGNIDLGTKNFCIMKYEAKVTSSSLSYLYDSTNMYCGNGDSYGNNNCSTNGNIILESKAEYKPLTRVNLLEARQLCKNLGKHYHLITNSEWITIARNIELQKENWAGGNIGSLVSNGGGLKRGNTGGTSSVDYDGSDPEFGTGRDEKAKLIFSNNESIWDFSGNVWEFTNETFNSNEESSFGKETSGWYQWTSIFGYVYLRSINLSYSSNFGIGTLYADVDDATPNGTIHIMARGGDYNDVSTTGIYALRTDPNDLFSNECYSFRCSYIP